MHVITGESLCIGTGRILDIALSRDDAYLVIATICNLEVWDMQKRQQLVRIVLASPAACSKSVSLLSGDELALIVSSWPRQIALSAGMTMTAAVLVDGSIKIWTLPNGKIRHHLTGMVSPAMCVVFSHDECCVISGHSDGVVHVWDLDTGTIARTLSSHTKTITAIALSRYEHVLGSASEDCSAILWDLVSGIKIHRLPAQSRHWMNPLASKGHNSKLTAIAFTADGQTVATGSDDRTLRMWNSQTGKWLATARVDEGVRSACFHPGDERIAISTRSGSIEMIHPNGTSDSLPQLEPSVAGPTFSSNGRLLLTGTHTGVHIWDVESETAGEPMGERLGPITKIGFSPANRSILAVGDAGGFVRLLGVPGGEETHLLLGHTGEIQSLCFSYDGATLATNAGDNIIRLWDTFEGKLTRQLELRGSNTGALHLMDFLPDSDEVMYYAGDGSIRLWNPVTGKKGHILFPGDATITALSNDKSLLAVASCSGSIKIWNLENRRPMKVLRNHDQWITSLSFGVGDSVLAALTNRGRLLAWDVESGNALSTLDDLESDATAIAFSRAGGTLAVGGNCAIRFFDFAAGKETGSFPAHLGLVAALAFSPDDCILASGSCLGILRLWSTKISSGSASG